MKNKFMVLIILLMTISIFSGCSVFNDKDYENADEQEYINKEELSFEEIEKLAEDASFEIYWYTDDDEFSSGTGFVMESEKYGQKLLVTALHCIKPDEVEKFTAEDLVNYVKGGELYYAKSGDDSGARFKNCIMMDDIDVAPQINKDVAAFTIQGNTDLKTLKLSDRNIKEGEPVYLLANPFGAAEPHENCVYVGEAIYTQDGVLAYYNESKSEIMGASGGPIVDKYGEVVAICIAGDENYILGHTAKSFLKKIDSGNISEQTYPEEPFYEDFEY